MNKSMKDVLGLIQPMTDVGIKESGVENPLYYSVDYPNGRKQFGKSNRKMNRFETLDRIKAVKKVSFPGCDKVTVYSDKEEWILAQKQKMNV